MDRTPVVPEDDSVAFQEALGAALREAREKRGWSQEELGFEAEIDRTYVSGVERGVRNPTVVTLLRLCRALGTKPSAVFRQAEQDAGP